MANPRCYSVYSQDPVASPTKSTLGITSATTIRPEIYDVLLGSSATPADNAINWRAQRYTAAGTNTARTPSPLDPGDPASLASGAVTHTAEPTYTSGLILFSLALNQRASHRWVADPRGPMKMPATASNGIGFYPVHASFTGNTDITVYFCE